MTESGRNAPSGSRRVGEIAVSSERTDRPEDTDDAVIPIARRLQNLGGEYDGWGCEIIN